MRKLFVVASYLLLVSGSFAQTINQKLQKAFHQFESDAQLKQAASSLYVIDAKTSKVVFDKNSQIGLAPASTQKIITSVTAFELLGKNYRYKTEFGIDKDSGSSLYILPSGDPTFGSWRWNKAASKEIIKRIIQSIPKEKKEFGSILYDNRKWDFGNIPDGWIWQDVANYYGAGAEKLNWRENQFDIILESGTNIGDPVQIIKTEPILFHYDLNSIAVSAEKGSGDNAYIYFPINEGLGTVKGTIPIKEKRFVISGALPSASNQFIAELIDTLTKLEIVNPGLALEANERHKIAKIEPKEYKIIHTEISPSLDSIIYWFLKKSINLYGEALLKTIAYEKYGFGSTDSGVNIVKDFWKQKGLDENELNIYDGSGLSPLNRVTTHAQVQILKYAKGKSWYPYFYDALPEFNGMKMKSGTISDVKGFCGYHKAKDGKEYIFSFLVNNYNGSASTLVTKMYKVLDGLK